MTGTIKTYLENKQYGFIKGDDNKDYFFHQSDIHKQYINKICENALVSFDQKATPKGYSATNISIKTNSHFKYYIPEQIYTSKSNEIKGWEIVDISNWIVGGNSRNSPDDAKYTMIDGANAVGANAIINMEYYKTTESEDSDSGKGTYYYTVHHFRGRLVNIGKKSLTGSLSKNDLIGINNDAQHLKNKLSEKTNTSKNRKYIATVIMSLITLIIWLQYEALGNYIAFFAIVPTFLLFHFFEKDYDSWLVEIQ